MSERCKVWMVGVPAFGGLPPSPLLCARQNKEMGMLSAEIGAAHQAASRIWDMTGTGQFSRVSSVIKKISWNVIVYMLGIECFRVGLL